VGRPPLPVGSWGRITTVRLDAGGWRASCRVRDVDGRVRSVARFAQTKGRADAALKAELLNRTQPTSGSRITPLTSVADCCAVWLAGVEQSDRSSGTKHNYRNAAKREVLAGPLANIPLNRVTVAAVANAVRSVQRGQYAVKIVYNGLFDLAVEHGALAVNPARAVRGSTLARKALPAAGARDTRRSLTRQQRDDLLASLDAADPHDVGDLLAFMLATGCRVGEALALRWSRVDADTGACRIEATVAKNGSVQEWTKTDADGEATRLKGRTVFLPAWMLERLKRRELTAHANAQDLIFPNTAGRPRTTNSAMPLIREALDSQQLMWATSHTLRRTAATLLDGAGMSTVGIANVLGHKRPSMTLDAYLDRRNVSAESAAIL
jgi:integrase